MMAASVLLAAMFGAAPAEARKYPKIFGSIELFSAKTARFPKWTGMLDRFQDGSKPCESSTCTGKGWKEFIAGLQGKDLATQLREVNRAFNAHRYILDIKNWGEEDYWETPYQFLKKDGDCEDYAISKYFSLKALGVPVEDMRVVALQDLNLNLGHAVLVVYVGEQPMLLDNQISSVVPANSIKHYNPVFSINETGWWLHRR
ncbi:MAG TPA: transglutaminase-like cysteine peptidase [Dongiaceae bacterium]|jgi:predicted transglutaminase-like cysteine proteinase|nr:transglutaminase-like cysteine peptidase [Dongiaceae bacterium]